MHAFGAAKVIYLSTFAIRIPLSIPYDLPSDSLRSLSAASSSSLARSTVSKALTRLTKSVT